MNQKQNYSEKPTHRESFLLTLIEKLLSGYKVLLEKVHAQPPFKIIEITKLSSVPGETEFKIQITNKSYVVQLSAAKIISEGYDLKNFNEFHAEMIRKAGHGKLVEYLHGNDKNPLYTLLSKKLDKTTNQYIFTIQTKDKHQFIRTAEEISKDKHLLSNMNINDIYDIGYTQGSESVLREKMALLLAKTQLNK